MKLYLIKIISSIFILFVSITSNATEFEDEYAAQVEASKKMERDFLEESERQRVADDNFRKSSEQRQEVEARVLLKKYGSIGPPSDFLVTQFKTYFGAAPSGNVGTIIKFYDKLDGKKKWDKRGDLWIIIQKRKDDVTGQNREILYVFKDLRSSQGFTWLDRVLIDKQDVSSSLIWDVVVQIIHK